MPSGAAADEVLERGRALFEGAGESGLTVAIGNRQVPARGISCAGCHGRDAGGGAEVQSGPAIDWQTLSAQGYGTADLVRVLTEGVRPDGTRLGGAMPRFGLADPGDPVALKAYLGAVAVLQRSGLGEDRILFHRGNNDPASAPFWQAFEAQIARQAPHGLFGRRIALTGQAAAFATIGATSLGDEAGRPDLFPLIPLLGDEDPADIRGAFATVAAQVRAVASDAGSVSVLADPDMALRLAPLLVGAEVRFSGPSDPPATGGAVMILDPARLAKPPEAAAIYATVDNLARLPDGIGGCVSAADPRPAPPSSERPLSRYGRIAATALVEALKLCGADCTRARLMTAFDRVSLPSTDWPALDYDTHRLAGTDAVVIRRLCG
ncbi:hypothetical protein [Paracoccus marinaquae]|uniref:Cytochrome c domain-containing protein n=1 Tax=Paracoccus marinaquae TaxID=2841926 RepID=A0ABS6AN87_9RHOB|nr:hypothetical protein [Paracoccus marinaquae]MBU3031104.1 hypothetical protein [Paracoccus marinaquae]